MNIQCPELHIKGQQCSKVEWCKVCLGEMTEEELCTPAYMHLFPITYEVLPTVPRRWGRAEPELHRLVREKIEALERYKPPGKYDLRRGLWCCGEVQDFCARNGVGLCMICGGEA
jgi:hypothetical protein